MHAHAPLEESESTHATPTAVARPVAWVALSLASLVVFAVLLALVESHSSSVTDRSTELAVHREFGSHTFPFFSAVSFVGGTSVRAALLVVISAVLFLARYRWTVAFLLVVQAGSIAGQVMKDIVARQRPHLFPGALHASGYSYPSGHALSAALLCGALAYLIWIRFGARPAMVLLPPLLVLAALLIGLSRIVLGVHYPSDVEGGFALGLAWLYAAIAVFGAGVRREAQAHSPTVASRGT